MKHDGEIQITGFLIDRVVSHADDNARVEETKESPREERLRSEYAAQRT